MSSMKQYAKDYSESFVAGLDVLGLFGEFGFDKINGVDSLENSRTISSKILSCIYNEEDLPAATGFFVGAAASFSMFGIPSLFLATLDGAYNSVRLAKESISKYKENKKPAPV